MKEAKEVNWADLRQFAEVLGTKGFKPDRGRHESGRPYRPEGYYRKRKGGNK